MHKGLKVCIVFEGRDGAGKGGTIKAITERVSPRVFRVIALPAPSEREKTQMYLQRYLPHLPAAGEIVIFDRSWYNRAGVERVMGFCTDEQADRFLKSVPLVEKAIVDSGIILLKYWLEVSPEEQTRRLKARIADGRKIWKLSPMDLKSYNRWYDYSRARDAMFAATDTAWAPWYVARSEDKKRVRLNIISHLLRRIPHEDAPREKVKLPERQKAKGYREPRLRVQVRCGEVLRGEVQDEERGSSAAIRSASSLRAADVALAGLEIALAVDRAEQLHQARDEPRPAGLVAGAEARAVVAVEVFVEQDVVAPVRVVLELGDPAIDRPAPLVVAQEDARKPRRELLRHLEQVHHAARTGRAFDLECVAVVEVILRERADDQHVDRHPDRPAPVGVAAEHARVGLGRKIADAELLPAGLEDVGVIQVMA